MKKVLVFIFTPTYGGPHNQVNRMYHSMLERQYETVLCAHKDFDSKWDTHFNSLGITVIKYDFKRLRFSSFLKNNLKYITSFSKDITEICEIIQQVNPDVVQVCGLLNIQAVLASRRLNIPVVWQLLSTFSPRPLRYIYGRMVGKWSNSIMSTGTLVARKHYLNDKISPKLFPFYPPVDTSQFVWSAEKRIDARIFFGLPDDVIIIGTVGNRNRQKAHDEFVRIAKKVLAITNKEVYFVVVGAITQSYQKTYFKLVEQFVLDNSLSEKVKFFESTIPVDSILSGFDIFLLSSMAEGVPTVLLEAMSIGLPIVSTQVGSIPEIIKNGHNGFLYSHGNSDQASNHLMNLINDQKLRRFISDNNAKDGKEKYDTNVCSDVHKEAYDFSIRHSTE